MIRVACACLWTCALFTLTAARIYDRCELARELMGLGINHEDIATWVCIAFHESRFDTAANNPSSGDHGLFQISELYWCGPGKACGLPCSSLRNEDIRDDLQCALQVHEEHTRLQGDGFLAWVVYPQHCRQNPKKYVVDCDYQPKHAPMLRSQLRPISATYDDVYYNNITRSNYNNYPQIDSLLPPYLSISSIYRANYGKQMDYKKGKVVDKIENIDQLKLPVLGKVIDTTTTTTTSTTYVPPVVPWRTIETNQFRKKVVQISSTLRPVESTTVSATTTTTTPRTKITTKWPFASFTTADFSDSNDIYISRAPSSTTIASEIENIRRVQLSSTTYKPSVTTSSPYTSRPSTTSTVSTTYKSVTTAKPTTTTRFSPASINFKTNNNATRHALKTVPSSLAFNSPTPKSDVRFAFTQSSFVSTRRPQIVTKSSPSDKIQTTTRKPSTQSIFDLYLNPTTKARLPSYDEYAALHDGQHKLRIFSGGTTTPSPFSWDSRDQKS